MPQNQNFQKKKKKKTACGDIIFLHKRTQNYDHMMFRCK